MEKLKEAMGEGGADDSASDSDSGFASNLLKVSISMSEPKSISESANANVSNSNII